MDNLISNDATINNDDINAVKEAKKRTSYVSKDHQSMVEFVAGVYKNLGYSEYHSNKAIAAVHLLSPDSIKQHLTSAQQYRLLEIKFGVGYKVTDLFKRIFLPVNDVERRAAIIESLKSPDTYQQLFKEYEFHVVPPVNGIKNHFVRNFHFKEDVAEKSAFIFIENLKEYGLLDARGVLISGMVAKPVEVERNTEPITEVLVKQDAPPITYTSPSRAAEDDLFELPIPLPNKRRAYLRYPVDNLTRKDINVITKALEFIASSLEDE